MLCYELFLLSSALRTNKIVRILFNGVLIHFIDYLKKIPYFAKLLLYLS